MILYLRNEDFLSRIIWNISLNLSLNILVSFFCLVYGFCLVYASIIRIILITGNISPAGYRKINAQNEVSPAKRYFCLIVRYKDNKIKNNDGSPVFIVKKLLKKIGVAKRKKPDKNAIFRLNNLSATR